MVVERRTGAYIVEQMEYARAILYEDRASALYRIDNATNTVQVTASPKMVIPEGQPNPAAPVQIENLLLLLNYIKV